jgi:hypothetical protein
MEKDSTPLFVPGLELAEGFCHDAVKPILDAEFPGLKYTPSVVSIS